MTLPDPDSTWRLRRCLACFGKGTRIVYRWVGGGRYWRIRIACRGCGGTGITNTCSASAGLAHPNIVRVCEYF
jgi:DnaJ-class molecular chaperone